jgi:hypothetical protein
MRRPGDERQLALHRGWEVRFEAALDHHAMRDGGQLGAVVVRSLAHVGHLSSADATRR